MHIIAKLSDVETIVVVATVYFCCPLCPQYDGYQWRSTRSISGPANNSARKARNFLTT